MKDIEDPTYNWQRLIDQANKEQGKDEEW